MPDLSRSDFLKLTGAGIAGLVLPGSAEAQANPAVDVTEEQIKVALRLANLSFDDDEVKEMVGSVKGFGEWWPPLRAAAADAGFMGMNWRVVGDSVGPRSAVKYAFSPSVREVTRPTSDEDLAFMSVADLSYLLRNGHVTSVELTKLFLARLKKYGPKLKCVVNLTEDRAMRQAAAADEMLKSGRFRHPLCGIPFGVKDLFDAKGSPTTWGIRTRKDHVSEEDCDVVQILENIGAVLVAKLSLGALAMGDVWYEGRTESPWDAKLGSSGSSAGSASAVAAGLVPFAIGTETNGSLVSPAHNCRVTTIRPTFGSVSRDRAMALCWSLDKVGPICRSAEDCAFVLGPLMKVTGNDPSQIERPYVYERKDSLKSYKWGYLVYNEADLEKPLADLNRPWLKALRDNGVEPKPVFLPPFPEGLYSILFAECAAAFESFTRSEDIQDLEGYSSWPESFRSGRLIPAVEYIQADRFRRVLAKTYAEILAPFDAVVADDRLYQRIFGLNATGIPQMLIPAGVDDRGRGRSFSLISPHFGEAEVLAAGGMLQEKLGFHHLRPDMSIWG